MFIVGRHTSRLLSRTLFWLLLIAATVSLFTVVRGFFFQTFRIVSSSMEPALLPGDLILVQKSAYRGIAWLGNAIEGGLPQRGDIVVFSRFSEFQSVDPNTNYIKRIVGVPGDTVTVYRDGIVVGTEPQRNEIEQSGDNGEVLFGPMQLRAGQYFVSGDNMQNSQDSRYYGPIHVHDIIGRAVGIIWSVDRFMGGFRPRWERFASTIPTKPDN